MTDVSQFDKWLVTDAVAAVVIREYLIPIEGSDGVLFPATYAAGDGFPGGYNIDPPDGNTNVCLVDSVGSQANRIEPIFSKPGYAELIPQIVVKAGERRSEPARSRTSCRRRSNPMHGTSEGPGIRVQGAAEG